jgi:glycosyltransferase involved in cell wall biosynthesis
VKVLLIGAANIGQQPSGGEEFKNQILFHKLSENYDCRLIDTIHWKENPLVVLNLVLSIFFRKSDSIIISASSLSSYRLIKILSYFPNKIKKTNYFVIGGYFPEGLNKGVYKSKFYKGLNKIVVEGEMFKNEIILKHNLNNVEVIPNFKKFNFLPTERELQNHPKRFVFLSLISEDKGCDIIFRAVERLNALGISQEFTFSFYGKIDESYREKFLKQIKLIGSNINYKGYIDLMYEPNESYLELSEYDCLVFPTYYIGEGFPGVLLDSFIAGLPVIASNWNMNKELIIHGINGLIVSPKSDVELATAMEKLLTDNVLLNYLKGNSVNVASRYHIDNLWPTIRDVVDSK